MKSCCKLLWKNKNEENQKLNRCISVKIYNIGDERSYSCQTFFQDNGLFLFEIVCFKTTSEKIDFFMTKVL